MTGQPLIRDQHRPFRCGCYNGPGTQEREIRDSSSFFFPDFLSSKFRSFAYTDTCQLLDLRLVIGYGSEPVSRPLTRGRTANRAGHGATAAASANT